MGQSWVEYLPSFVRGKIHIRQDVVSNIGWQAIDNLVRLGVGLLLSIWVARYLGPERFGLLSYALALVALLSPLATLGLDDIAVRNLVREPAVKNAVLGTACLLKLLGGLASLAVAVAVILALRPADRLSQWLVAIIAAGAVFQAVNVIEFWFNAQVRAKYIVLAKNAAFLLSALVKIGLILSGAPLVAFAWVATLEIAAGSGGLIVAYRYRGDRLRQWHASWETAKSLLRDSWPLMFSCIVIMFYLRIDQIMLAELVGSEEVGVYSVAVRLAEAWFFVPTIIYWSLLPTLVEAKATSDALFHAKLQKYYNLMALLAYAIAVPVTLLAPWLVRTLFGAEFARAGAMLAVLMWANLFTYLEIARSAYFNVMNWNRVYLATLALGAALNVLLNWLLIPRYGGLGAAIASCVSYWFSTHGACFLYKPLHRTGFMLSRALLWPKVW